MTEWIKVGFMLRLGHLLYGLAIVGTIVAAVAVVISGAYCIQWAARLTRLIRERFKI